MSLWDEVDEATRTVLSRVAGLLPNPALQDAVFAAGVVTADHLFRPWKAIL